MRGVVRALGRFVRDFARGIHAGHAIRHGVRRPADGARWSERPVDST
ncbi:hypothetical protein SAMN05216215_100791 [Saccharopolyspora shandongensis]|uniref:Uncharacterized protein n=1 Tax=Saccharopolyspora shandongensis TaxID=418495 RepID=A0A1H2YN19_9PSEU|nr:hypothetical protein [Saccharopolyspora shandongensis]SDX06381.1 hypothetical protein SAMN05216215_100791 [Saccharopolyspora shandongensis]